MKILQFLLLAALLILLSGFIIKAKPANFATLKLGVKISEPTPMPPAPERELRGAWMATVMNIDYPQSPTIDAASLQADFRSQLYRLKAIGINAVFVQVRPAGDAFYPSQLAPWSKWLTGRQGIAPASGFDPLAFMIQEAHARGMQFHAWVNPYRVSMDLDSFSLARNHVFYQHRDWVKIYGDKMYLDPGIPQVQDHLLTVIKEILQKYQVDGIHFDDYFYPYPILGTTFPDRETYARYAGAGQTREGWRRSNVNAFVSKVSGLIQAEKPWVQFGISPFGVWRNKAHDPKGSQTTAAATSYDDLFADALHWARQGWVDYLAPQLYWSIGYPPADYAHLLAWWTANTHPSVKLYIGQASYKVAKNPVAAWNDLEEIPRQIKLNRQNKRVHGSIFFNTNSLLASPVGLDQRLGDIYNDQRLVPAKPRSALPEKIVPKLKKPKASKNQGTLLSWKINKKITPDQQPYYYAIFKAKAGGTEELIHVTPFEQNGYRFQYLDKAATSDQQPAIYKVIPIDRYHELLN